jgi:hypothetical protein
MKLTNRFLGDGNCLYRSLGYSLLEQSLTDQSRLVNLKSILEKIKWDKEVFRKFNLESISLDKNDIAKEFPQYISLLALEAEKNLKEGKILQNIQCLMKIMNEVPKFDAGLVLFVRTLAAQGIRHFSDHPELDEDLSNQMVVFTEELEDVYKYGVEGVQLVINTLAKYLEITVKVHYIERNQVNKEKPKLLTDLHAPSHASYNPKLEIDLYFRPGYLKMLNDYLYNLLLIKIRNLIIYTPYLKEC